MSDTEKKVTTSQIEGVKLAYDYLKHLTTLSTGTVVVLATFVSKLDNVQNSSAAKHALVALIIAIVSSTMCASLYAVREQSHEVVPPGGVWLSAAMILWVVTTLAFIYALVSLALFAAANIR